MLKNEKISLIYLICEIFSSIVKFSLRSNFIYNKKNSKILSKKAKLYKNPLSKSLGLMFSKKNKTLIFISNKEKIIPLHMFFVFYPIDVLFLDKNKKVVEIKENFKPFTFYIPKNKARYVIELPYKTIKKTKTNIGDTISFKPTILNKEYYS